MVFFENYKQMLFSYTNGRCSICGLVRTGNKIKFGLYPQTLVSDADLISTLNVKALFQGVAYVGDGYINSPGVGNWNNVNTCSMGGVSEPITHFANDKSIFVMHVLAATPEDNLMLREMTSEYGLLPIPKYDKDQENYGTTAHDAYTLVTVIDHSESSVKTKGEAISVYLQYSYEESYDNILPWYFFERILQKDVYNTDTVEKSRMIFKKA